MSIPLNIGYRPTWVEVDLDNLGYNLLRFKNCLPAGIKIMACVKADAYGHGMIPVARHLLNLGVDYLGVASIDEGIKLRKTGIEAVILVLGAAIRSAIEPFFDYRLCPTVCSLDTAQALDRLARRFNRRIKIHLKVDTGMGRIGVLDSSAGQFVKQVRSMSGLIIEGIFTHFACADSDERFTQRQIDRFQGLIKALAFEGINIPLVHAANSVAAVGLKTSCFDMARPGLVLYGLYPKSDMKISLKPLLSLRTKVVFIKEVPANYGISYGHRYRTRKRTRIAILPIGYGDGYPRNLSNIGPVLIGGECFKISGTVCMDQMAVDIGFAKVKVGDEAVLIGRQGGKKIGVEELAVLAQTIPYEIVCGLGSRVPRLYKCANSGFLLAGSDDRGAPQEKRVFNRFKLRLPVKVYNQSRDFCRRAMAVDVGAKGAGLILKKPVKTGSRLEIVWGGKSKYGGRDFSSAGRIAWVDSQEVQGYRAGIEFMRVDLDVLNRLLTTDNQADILLGQFKNKEQAQC